VGISTATSTHARSRGVRASRHPHLPHPKSSAGPPPGTRMRSAGTRMHGARQNIARPRRGRNLMICSPELRLRCPELRLQPQPYRASWRRPRQTRAPMCSSRRGQCGARARPCRTASALTVPTCSGVASKPDTCRRVCAVYLDGLVQEAAAGALRLDELKGCAEDAEGVQTLDLRCRRCCRRPCLLPPLMPPQRDACDGDEDEDQAGRGLEG
jgi:hypothetical protein